MTVVKESVEQWGGYLGRWYVFTPAQFPNDVRAGTKTVTYFSHRETAITVQIVPGRGVRTAEPLTSNNSTLSGQRRQVHILRPISKNLSPHK